MHACTNVTFNGHCRFLVCTHLTTLVCNAPQTDLKNVQHLTSQADIELKRHSKEAIEMSLECCGPDFVGWIGVGGFSASGIIRPRSPSMRNMAALAMALRRARLIMPDERMRSFLIRVASSLSK